VNKIYFSPFLLVLLFFTSGNLFSQVAFIENKGQWDSSVKYMSHAGDGSFFIQKNGYTITQFHPDDVKRVTKSQHDPDFSKMKSGTNNDRVRSHSYHVEFLNSSDPVIVPEKPLETVNNYFIGNDKSKWAEGCKIYQAITYKNIYPNIDLRYYLDGGNNLKYDFIIHPGGDVNRIAMKYSGASSVDVVKKELVVTTSLGKSRELQPYTYQVIDNQRKEVECKYQIKGNIVRFKVKNHDPHETLIIDPTQIFFSYSGSTADNWGFTATYGKDGSLYGGGIVFGQGFPVNTGAYDQSYNGDYDMSIIKLSPNGNNRIYATYIGGARSDQPHSLIEDSQGNLVIAGRSNSQDYPTTVPHVGPGGTTDYDIVVTKLNASGSALIGSMKIGGSGSDGVNIADQSTLKTLSLKRNYGDDARSEVILDGADNIYLTSSTSSTDFPVTPGVLQPNLAGKQDAVVLKINPTCNNILISTYLGGKGDDAGYVLAIGLTGNIYVAGGTGSNDLKGISSAGVIKPNFSAPGITADDADGFVVELNPSATAAVRGTYIGTGSADQIYGIEIDKGGFVYVMGTSEGNMPVINANYSVNRAKQFISKLQPDLSDFVYSTVFGSPNAPGPNISPTAFLVDRCENVYVSGWGGKANNSFSLNSTTLGMPTTAGAIKSVSDPTGSDFYLFVLKKNAESQLYGTFFGQDDSKSFGDHVDGGTSRFDRNGIVYQAICANCGNNVPFPGTPGSWSPRNMASPTTGGACNLGMLKIEMDFTGVKSAIQSIIDGVKNDSVGCAPLTVQFKDTLGLGKQYFWDFGDGSGDTTLIPSSEHIFPNVGNYRVRLVTVDSSTCNISDTSYVNIRVGNNKLNLDFLSEKLPPCTNLSYIFTNKSIPSFGGFRPDTFIWDFGDGTPPVTQSYTPAITHTYGGPGTYNVKLTVKDDAFCNSPADTIKSIRISPEVKSIFTTPLLGCVPYTAQFVNNSLGGLRFEWDFGDGSVSDEVTPVHLYPNPGTYTIRLKAFDSTSCNLVDESSVTIQVSPNPTAAFNYTPLQPQENTATNFANQSLGATSYLWNFGDGDSSNAINPSHYFPATGTYNVCLNAKNDAGCIDTACMNVKSLISPLLAVPSAFTPGVQGSNNIIKVEGFGIRQMTWSIYNRWGQKVFETNSRKMGWDGKYKGKLQPVDVYTYTLDVTFTDGTKTKKTGDITLIR
jgi:gliding motility-associated-like protein